MSNLVSIVILDFLKADRVLENVNSLLTQKTNFNFDIYVIDNSVSQNNAKKLLKLNQQNRVKVIINKENLGYSKAYNQVVSGLKSKYIFIVNPDILWPKNNIVQKMINFMEKNKKVGIMGPRQLNDQGQEELNARRFPKFYVQICRRTFLKNIPFFKRKIEYDALKGIDFSQMQEVDWLQSSCIVIRKELWDLIGGFNEEYFLFMADTELSYQSWKNNYKVILNSEIYVQSDGIRLSSGGVGKFFVKKTIRSHLKDALKYYWNRFCEFK